MNDRRRSDAPPYEGDERRGTGNHSESFLASGDTLEGLFKQEHEALHRHLYHMADAMKQNSDTTAESINKLAEKVDELVQSNMETRYNFESIAKHQTEQDEKITATEVLVQKLLPLIKSSADHDERLNRHSKKIDVVENVSATNTTRFQLFMGVGGTCVLAVVGIFNHFNGIVQEAITDATAAQIEAQASQIQVFRESFEDIHNQNVLYHDKMVTAFERMGDLARDGAIGGNGG
jgi:hypothetical protein